MQYFTRYVLLKVTRFCDLSKMPEALTYLITVGIFRVGQLTNVNFCAIALCIYHMSQPWSFSIHLFTEAPVVGRVA